MTIGFKGLGWFLCGLVVAPGCYLVTSQVAAERARVESVERAIRQARRDIRDLETEFRARASFDQLERWNGEVFALVAPQSGQFAGGPADLAALMGGDASIEQASLLVPAAPIAPVVLDEPAAAPDAAVADAPAAVAPPPARSEERPRVVRVASAVVEPARPEPRSLDKTLLSDAMVGDLLRGARAESGSRR